MYTLYYDMFMTTWEYESFNHTLRRLYFKAEGNTGKQFRGQ